MQGKIIVYSFLNIFLKYLKIIFSATKILWLNSEERGTDLTERFRDQINLGLLTIDENLQTQVQSTNDCLALKVHKNENGGLISARLTTRNCNDRANVFCSIDLFQPKAVSTKPKFSCLQSTSVLSANKTKNNYRKKRKAVDERSRNSATYEDSK